MDAAFAIFLSPYSSGVGPGARLGWRSNSQTLQRGRTCPGNRGNPPPNNETQQPKSGFFSGTYGARDVSAIACRTRSVSKYPSRLLPGVSGLMNPANARSKAFL